MLNISQHQFEALGDAGRASYLEELRERFVERSPRLAATMNEEQQKQAVAATAEAAASYGFTHRGPMRLYLDLCVSFGSGFVNDPAYHWAGQAIGDADTETQSECAEVLFESAVKVLDEVSGPDDCYALAALQAIPAWAQQPHDIEESLLEEYAVMQMSALHPQKALYAGDDALRTLFWQAHDACLDLGVTTSRPIVLTTALKFAFGAGCLTDPFYGWIGATLAMEKVEDKAVRFERLERKALIWLDAVLSKQG